MEEAKTLSQEALHELNTEFESAPPQDILRWAAHTYQDRLAVVTSFQPTGIVTLHMLAEIAPNTPVLTLDTGLLFPETLTLIDTLEQRFHLNLRRIRPAQSVEDQAAVYGPDLWVDDPDRCCRLRKTMPLKQALSGCDAWITGLRRDQSAGRAATPVIAWDARHGRVKLSPFATWTVDMIWTYIHAYELPYNALHDRGYPSIGCYPCTQAVAAEAPDQRAGRWANHAKTECGIHIPIPEPEQVPGQEPEQE